MITGNEDCKTRLGCAELNQSGLVHMLPGNVLHLGGLAFTGHPGTVIGLKGEDQVLDVAGGYGASTRCLAKRSGCQDTGLDYGQGNILISYWVLSWL